MHRSYLAQWNIFQNIPRHTLEKKRLIIVKRQDSVFFFLIIIYFYFISCIQEVHYKMHFLSYSLITFLFI